MSDNDSLRPEDFEPHRVTENDARSPRETMSAVLRQNPLLRLAVIILPVIVVVVLILGVFGGSKKAPAVSKVDTGSSVKDTSNTGSVNEAYRKAVEEANQQKVAAAQNNGGSVITTPPPPVIKPVETASTTDPLAAFTQVPQPPLEKVPTVRAAPPQAQQPQAGPQLPKYDQQLAQSFGSEMRTIIGGLNPKPLVITHVTKKAGDESDGNGNASNITSQIGQQGQDNQRNQHIPILVTAGTVLYAQTLTEADSDVPAPILVSMLSGPFQGGRAIGTFQKADEYLILAFGTIIKGKKEYHVNALAMDPETTLTALETDIDHHYFERFVLPAAAGFISGVGNYTQQAGSTVTNSTFGVTQSYPPLNTHQEILAGLGQGANAIASAIQQEANVPITIHVASGTPIGCNVH